MKSPDHTSLKKGLNQLSLFEPSTVQEQKIFFCHEAFLEIEEMNVEEYKYGGRNLNISYSFGSCNFGDLLIASTKRGVCHISFADDHSYALHFLQSIFPEATYQLMDENIHQQVLDIFLNPYGQFPPLKLHIKGTVFQFKVWKELLKIPVGQVTTYGKLACILETPNASRAVGSAVGDNPIAFLIPCHRVVRADGGIGGYHWMPSRKKAILNWEAAGKNTDI